MHTYKDLGSIKSSTNKTSESIKSEFTCCSISFARALVIGPILISLGLFTIGSSVYVGGVTVVGMSSSRGDFQKKKEFCMLFKALFRPKISGLKKNSPVVCLGLET